MWCATFIMLISICLMSSVHFIGGYPLLQVPWSPFSEYFFLPSIRPSSYMTGPVPFQRCDFLNYVCHGDSLSYSIVGYPVPLRNILEMDLSIAHWAIRKRLTYINTVTSKYFTDILFHVCISKVDCVDIVGSTYDENILYIALQ